MLIRGARIAIDSHRAVQVDLRLQAGLVSLHVGASRSSGLHLRDYLVLPGLINAHDHLELNLFPNLGHGPYRNASAWAKDIYHPDEPPVKEHLQVGKQLRLRWGGFKNLISGVTTVAHHNAFEDVFLENSFPIRVVKRYGWAHSVEFSPDWEARFRSTPPNYPFVIHAAEGTDEAANHEIRILAKAGALSSSTVLVHGIAIDPSDVPLLRRANTSLIWCPTSNHFTMHQSIDSAVLNSGISIALGSDSAITAAGDLLDEVRFAARSVGADRAYEMVTSKPARMLKLPSGFGRICEEGPADLLIIRDSSRTPALSLLENTPEMVIAGGRVQLVSKDLARLCPASVLNRLEPIGVEGRGAYLVAGDIASMLSETKAALQSAPRLAGKAVAA